MKLSIIIPVFNEKETISEVLKKIEGIDLENLEKEIIIIDDGSTDGTLEILNGLEKKYKILYHEKNEGKGRALKDGFAQSTGDIILIQDADLEYNPSDIPKLLNAMILKGHKVVYGSRNLTPNPVSGLSYKLGGILITKFFNFLFGQRLSDINTGYKLFKREALYHLKLRENRFAFCEEFSCQLVKSGYKIKEVPISYCPRNFSEGKKIRWWHGIRSIYVILRERFSK